MREKVDTEWNSLNSLTNLSLRESVEREREEEKVHFLFKYAWC